MAFPSVASGAQIRATHIQAFQGFLEGAAGYAQSVTIVNNVANLWTFRALTADPSAGTVLWRVRNAADSANFFEQYYDGPWKMRTATPYLRLLGTEGSGDDVRIAESAGALLIQDNTGTEGTPTWTTRVQIDVATGKTLIGDTADADVTIGLVLNQGANDDGILSFKSSDVAHGMTTLAETDTWGLVKKGQAAAGGLLIHGLDDGGGNANGALILQGTLGQAALTTKSSVGYGVLRMSAAVKDTTGKANVGADGNLLSVENNFGVFFILDADGDSHQDVGVAWTNFDDHDDAALLDALSAGVSRPGDPVRERFGALLAQYRPTLERNRLVTFNDDGHHFINWSRTHMVVIGAVRQMAQKIGALTAEVETLRRQLPEGRGA